MLLRSKYTYEAKNIGVDVDNSLNGSHTFTFIQNKQVRAFIINPFEYKFEF